MNILRVLIVEDSHTVSKVLKHLIVQELGYHVDIAPDMSCALTLLEQHQYFVVVADLNLPDASNGDIVRLVLSSYKTPCIVLTSNLDAHQRREILKLGIVDYIPKDNRYSYQYVVKLIDRLYRNQQVKVLVADDSVVSRKFVRMLLEHHLFQVLEANDGEEALEVLEREPDIQLLITDYNMPKIDGVELILRVREKYHREDIAIIGLSNDNDESLSAKFIKNGANDFLQKPFVHEEFHCRVMQTMEQLALIADIKESAYRDHLTGLYNRRYFYQYAEKLLKNVEQENVLALLDIDFFKNVNDQFGHEAGDQVLVEMANRMQATMRKEDVLIRFGGDEFIIAFVPKAESVDEINFVVTKLLEQFNTEIILQQNVTAVVSGSVGIAISPEDGKDIDTLIANADIAMYQSKREGKNRATYIESMA